jgi:acyl carrier protein
MNPAEEPSAEAPQEQETNRIEKVTPDSATAESAKSVGDQVKAIIADKLDVARDKVKDEANLQTDLGADSLDIVELLMHLEDNFDMKIPDEDAENLKTVGDAIKYIEANTVKE